MRRRQIFAKMAEAAKAAFFTPEVQEKPEEYRCECGKTFKTANWLKIHKGRAHK